MKPAGIDTFSIMWENSHLFYVRTYMYVSMCVYGSQRRKQKLID